MRFLPAVLFAALGPLAVIPAHADTTTQNFTVNFGTVGQTSENTRGFLLFDPALGTLDSARVDLTASILFAPAGPDARYTLNFGNYARNSPTFTISDNQTEMFQTNGPVDPANSIGNRGFTNYIIAFLDLSVRDGTVLAGSTATGTLTYNYTPAAVTPEPSTLLLVGSAALAACANLRRRLRI